MLGGGRLPLRQGVQPAKSGASFWTLGERGRHNAGEAGVPARRAARLPRESASVVQSFVFSAVLLGLLVACGVVAIVAVRSRWLESGADRGDWETALVGYKNLRDKGVLSEEEYRKISTLVEPRVRVDSSAPDQIGRAHV